MRVRASKRIGRLYFAVCKEILLEIVRIGNSSSWSKPYILAKSKICCQIFFRQATRLFPITQPTGAARQRPGNQSTARDSPGALAGTYCRPRQGSVRRKKDRRRRTPKPQTGYPTRVPRRQFRVERTNSSGQ